ncbi:MAG TPA: peptidoglycan recognition family protein [Phycisphaerae bacterium]|nr:peptidoglycan recognition family protein [Phycisphaerae bacterium]
MSEYEKKVDLINRAALRLSRRGFLSALAGGAIYSALSGCGSPPQNNAPAASASDDVVNNLPEGFLPNGWSYGQIGSPDIGYAPPENFQLPSYTPPPQPVAPGGPLGIIPRHGWTFAGPARSSIEPMGGVNLITFHHTGDPRPFYDDSYAGSAAFWERTRVYQVYSRDFQDIGYHFGIDRAGRVWQLRPLEYRGEHVRIGPTPPLWLNQYRQYSNGPSMPIDGRYVWNNHNIGVVSIGNFMLQEPTPMQKSKIVEFGTMLRRRYNIPIYHCYTHQELVSTECPGRNLQPYMEYIRRNEMI